MNLHPNPPVVYDLPAGYLDPADIPVPVAEVEYTATHINADKTTSVETTILSFNESVTCPESGYVSEELTLTIAGGAPGTWVSYTGDAVGSIQLNSNGYAAIKMNFLVAGEYIIALYFEGTTHKQRHAIKVYSPTVNLPATAVKNYPFTYSVAGAIPGAELRINDYLVGNIDSSGNLEGTVTIAMMGNYAFTFACNSWKSTQKIVIL